MIEKARKIEDNSEGNSYVYVIEANRQFRRPDLPRLCLVNSFKRGKLNDKDKEILDDLFTKIRDAGLNIDSSAYNSNYDNCFSFDEITVDEMINIYREYPRNGIVYWDDLYIPTWILLSFFIEGDTYYIGKSDGNLISRLKSHKNGETNFFKIHSPSNLVEVWDIDYHEYDSDFDYHKGLFNRGTSRAEIVEKHLTELAANRKDVLRCLVYSN
jgi:hypothetical protein